MDYAKSVTFVFDDPKWVTKIAIGIALVLVSSVLSMVIIGVLGFVILAGYSIRLLQNVRDGREYPLPEWDDWGGDFMRGLKYIAVGFVWALPLVIFAVPVGIGGALADGNNAANFFGVTILLCASCLMFLYGLFVALATPGFTIAFARDEEFTSGLQFTDIYHWTVENIGQVIVAVLVVLVAQFLLGIVGAILIICLVGPFLATFAISIFQHHVYGQLARECPFPGDTGGESELPTIDPESMSDAVTNLRDNMQ